MRLRTRLRRWFATFARKVGLIPPLIPFSSSPEYWEERYRRGGNSGAGSYNRLADFKARVINRLVRDNDIATVVEFGCGDGNQLTLAEYPDYLGVDVSSHGIELCRSRFHGDTAKRFCTLNDYSGETADLSLSLDVVYHLVEDSIFDDYLRQLFQAATKMVIVYSTNSEEGSLGGAAHVRHRNFTEWIGREQPDWVLAETIGNEFPGDGSDQMTSPCDFYVYRRAR